MKFKPKKEMSEFQKKNEIHRIETISHATYERCWLGSVPHTEQGKIDRGRGLRELEPNDWLRA